MYTKTGFGAREQAFIHQDWFGARGVPVYTKTGFGTRDMLGTLRLVSELGA